MSRTGVCQRVIYHRRYYYTEVRVDRGTTVGQRSGPPISIVVLGVLLQEIFTSLYCIRSTDGGTVGPVALEGRLHSVTTSIIVPVLSSLRWKQMDRSSRGSKNRCTRALSPHQTSSNGRTSTSKWNTDAVCVSLEWRTGESSTGVLVSLVHTEQVDLYGPHFGS